MEVLELLKFIKVKFPFIWNFIERINGIVVTFLFGGKIESETEKAVNNVLSEYTLRSLLKDDAHALVDFITQQPEGFDKFFKPHDFDLKSYKRVLSCGTYKLIGCFDGNKLVGYCFIRFVANKSAYRGKIVDSQYQGKGIAKQMGILMTKIAINSGFHLYATISKDNIASLQSSKAVNDIRIIKELPDNYVYIEYLGLKDI